MRRIKILALFVVATAFAACSGDEGFDIKDNSVKVVSSETEISAKGGVAKVSVDKNVTTAYSKDSWLTVSADGTNVTATAVVNGNKESRATELVIKASETDSVIVAVKQNGLVFAVNDATQLTVGDAASTKELNATFNTTVEAVSMPDWVTPTIREDGIALTFAENTTGHIRGGWAKFQSGSYVDSVYVRQGEAKDLEGTYYLCGYDGSTYKMTAVLAATVTCADGNITFDMTYVKSSTKYSWSFSATLDDNLYFDLKTRLYIGRYDTLYAGLFAWAPFDGYIATSTSLSPYRCQFDYDEDSGYTIGTFEDNGTWTYTVNGLIAYSCTSSTLATRKASIFRLIYPYFMKVA